MATVAPPWVTYQDLIARYFPLDQQVNAACIMEAETTAWASVCGATPPESCVVDLPPMSCFPTQPVQPAKAYGLYKIVDVCWDPALAGEANTPFTPGEWANILDPNYNVWAASVVWSIAGWRAWTTCGACANCPSCVYATPPCALPCTLGICGVQGGPVPYPRGPVLPVTGGYPISPLLAYGVIGVTLYGLAYLDYRGAR